MPCPFPGMDPFVEGPDWTSFHAPFCVEIVRRLNPELGYRYVAVVERRLVMDTLDDITISSGVAQPDLSVFRSGPRGATAVMERSAQPVVSLAEGAETLEPPLQVNAVMEVETPVYFVEIREVPS